jgi:Lrp/AsnC family leucine-responsive transcriptional regulator
MFGCQSSYGMNKKDSQVELDDIDCKILHILLKDARTQLKVIAEACGISSVSALNRIKRLKTLGVIKGAVIFPKVSELNAPIVATIGVNLKDNQTNAVRLLVENTNLVQATPSIGKYDLIALVHASSMAELDRTAFCMRRLLGVTKVDVNVWTSMPIMLFENLDLHCRGAGSNG